MQRDPCIAFCEYSADMFFKQQELLLRGTRVSGTLLIAGINSSVRGKVTTIACARIGGRFPLSRDYTFDRRGCFKCGIIVLSRGRFLQLRHRY
jgi:hypothetical protein